MNAGRRGYEFKWGTKTRAPEARLGTYPGSTSAVVNRDTWLDLLLGRC